MSCGLSVVGCEFSVLGYRLSVVILRENSEYRVKNMWWVKGDFFFFDLFFFSEL